MISWSCYLRAPLKRQATNSPGSPGRSLNTSITKYSTICTNKLTSGGTKDTVQPCDWLVRVYPAIGGTIYWSKTNVHLVIGFDVALVQRAVLSIPCKHDQTHQTA